MDNIFASVFDIQSYCIHDGPGIRTTVFLKGCPLGCVWCQNPESRRAESQLMTFAARCTGCGRCAPRCPAGAITPGPPAVTDRTLCTACGACVSACAAGARELSGKTMSAAAALGRVLDDKLFLESSGGGMTVSGGEPLAHADFTAALLSGARKAGLHTAMESCMFAPRAALEKVLPHLSLLYCDVKHMDSAAHMRLCRVPNETILDNIRFAAARVPVILRTPVVPTLNDSDENIAAAARFAASLGVPLELLAYHRLGESKAESLGAPAPLGIDPPSDAHLDALRELASASGARIIG